MNCEVLIMFKRVMLSLMIAVAASAATATEFEGVFEGLDAGMVALSGKTYPLRPDAMAHYEGRTVAIDLLPVGTLVKFELGEFAGVSSVVQMEITQASDTLDEMFPPH
jgi:hypothetical protein